MAEVPVKKNKPFEAFLVRTVVLASFFDMFSQLPIISPYASALGAEPVLVGLAVAMYSLTNMIGNFFAGQIIHQIGPVMAISGGLVAAGLAVAGYSQVTVATSFLVLRAVHGLGASVVVPAAYAYLGNLAAREQRGRQMALTGAAIGVAALAGPAFGGVLKDQLGVRFVFFTVATFLIIVAILARWILRENTPVHVKEQRAVALNSLLARQGLLAAYIAAFSLMFAKGTMAFSLPLYAESLGYSGGVTGALFSSFALAALLVFITPLNRLSDRVGRLRPITAGLLLVGVSLILLLLSGHLAYLLVVMFIYGIGFGLLFPAATAMVLDHTTPAERGTAFGLFYGLFSLGVVVGPVLSGWLVGWGIPPFLVGGMGALCGAVTLAGITKRMTVEESPKSGLGGKN